MFANVYKRKPSLSLFPVQNHGVQLQKMVHWKKGVYAMNDTCIAKSLTVERNNIVSIPPCMYHQHQKTNTTI